MPLHPQTLTGLGIGEVKSTKPHVGREGVRQWRAVVAIVIVAVKRRNLATSQVVQGHRLQGQHAPAPLRLPSTDSTSFPS